MRTEYNKLLRNPRWFQKRKIILERDQEKCRNCGGTEELHVHHKQYHIISRTGLFQLPWEYKNKYLVTLCQSCHSAGHSKYKVPTYSIS
jgi:5-methylcytosine-specific restriction endonuclease McrA